jgi:aryl-alcohol dehydrogenase-like predicted oxidoreductase
VRIEMPITYRNLGGSGLKISCLVLGTWYLPTLPEVDSYGVRKINEEMTLKLWRRAVDLGINCIDTANRYHGAIAPVPVTHVGYAERLLGRFLKTVDRESLVIATKVRFRMGEGPNDEGLSRKHILKAVRDSLERLQTSYIDLYQAHGPDPQTPQLESLQTFDMLVRMGLVHYIGCSNFEAWQIEEALSISERHGLAKFVSVQPLYNLIQRQAEKELFPLVRERGLGVICYSPLAQGLLAGRYHGGSPQDARSTYSPSVNPLLTERNMKVVAELAEMAREKGVTLAQLSLAWILHRPEVTAPIIGATRPEQLEENIVAADIRLSTDDLKRIDEITAAK